MEDRQPMTWTRDVDPGVANFPALIRQRMREPGKAFIRNDDGRTLSFDEAWTLAGRMAEALAGAGVGSGDRVAVQVDKSPEAIVLLLACMRRGAIYLPLNTAYTLAELDYFFGDAEPRVVVAAPARLADVGSLAGRHGAAALSLGVAGDGTLMEAAAQADDSVVDAATDWNDTAAILYTSGTTGRSKGAMLTHGNLASNALALVDAWRFTDRDVLFHALPIYHTHGLFTATGTLLLAGGTILFRSKFDADDCLRMLPEATAMMGVPTFYSRLLQHPGLTRQATAHMRVFISGSAPLLEETHRAFADRTGHSIIERYGMTETGMNTSNPCDGERRAGTVGTPLEDIEVRIVDPATGEPLAPGEIGMIELRGPNVFKGYWRMPEKTAAAFRSDGFFITGDLGRFDEAGYLAIVGRDKDLIITGGLNVYPKEVESEIDALPGVVESAVIGVPHADFGEAVTAVVVGEGGTDEDAILARLRDRLAGFKLPKRVVFVGELPRNAMGKVQKNTLRTTFADLYRQPEDAAMPEDAGREMKARLRADLRAAMKERRTIEAKVIRSLVAAIDNAEAPSTRPEQASLVQHSFRSQTAEVERLLLSRSDVHRAVLAEIDERERAAAELERLEQMDGAEALRAEALMARRYLD